MFNFNSHRERKRAVWQYGRVGKKARCRAHVSSHSPFGLNSVSAEKDCQQSNFHPGYRDLGRKIRDLGNRASPASHMNTSIFLQRKEWLGEVSETEPARLTGLIMKKARLCSHERIADPHWLGLFTWLFTPFTECCMIAACLETDPSIAKVGSQNAQLSWSWADCFSRRGRQR